MKPSTLIGAAIAIVGLILAVIIFALIREVAGSGGGEAGKDAQISTLEATVASQKTEIDTLTRQLAQSQEDQKALRLQLEAMPVAPPSGTTETLTNDEVPADLEYEDGAQPATEALAEQMKLAKERFNKGIIQPKNTFMLEALGQPRDSYNTACQPVTNPRLIEALETRQIGSFRLTMLSPALDSVQRIMERLQKDEPEIYSALGTAGALCARFIRGSNTSVSNHSWGTAVDLTLEGNLDAMGDNGTQFGLVILAEYFNDEGWYWGAGYGREDSMHFEVGEDLLKQWLAEGKL